MILLFNKQFVAFCNLGCKISHSTQMLIAQCNPSFRLAKAEDDHQVAIAEKLDLEARLNEELQMTKVCS